MSPTQTESWGERARRLVLDGRRHSGAAREAVIGLLDRQACGLSAVEIEDILRTGSRPVGRASIYRILEELERLGLVQRLQIGQTMARFEPVREGAAHHHHFVCDSCGTVTPFSDGALERAIEGLSDRVPMVVAEHEIVLHGSCRECT